MRTFVAVDVLSAAVIDLQNDILSTAGWNPGDVKPVDPQNIHFTLMFIGELGDYQLEKTKEKLAEVQFESFTLVYKGVGAFPSPAAARVLWVGVDEEGGQKLTALARDVTTKMAELGLKADKAFSPHVTLFRTKRGPVKLNKLSSKYEGMIFGFDQIDKVHLKKSELTKSGPIYSNIYTIQAHN